MLWLYIERTWLSLGHWNKIWYGESALLSEHNKHIFLKLHWKHLGWAFIITATMHDTRLVYWGYFWVNPHHLYVWPLMCDAYNRIYQLFYSNICWWHPVYECLVRYRQFSTLALCTWKVWHYSNKLYQCGSNVCRWMGIHTVLHLLLSVWTGHFISSSIRYPHKTDISVQNGNKRISDDLSYEEYILRGTDQLVHQIVKHKTIYLNVSWK